MGKSPLLRVPNEIVLLIAENLSPSECAPLLRCSRYFHQLLTYDFYRHALNRDNGMRGLQFAASTGSTIVADVFISRYGICPNTRLTAISTHGQTCLHVAAALGHEPLIHKLIALGADVNARNDQACTPLHQAALMGQLGTARVLAEHGGDVMARDGVDETPLHAAAKKGHHQVCDFLLQKGADVDAKCKDPQNEVDDGYTPLHGAADFGHVQVAILLLDWGAEIDAKIDSSEWTPLGCASAEGHEGVVTILLNRGADVNVSPEMPLRLAVDGKWHEGVLRLLLRYGADVNRAKNGMTLSETVKRLEEFAARYAAEMTVGPNLDEPELNMPIGESASKPTTGATDSGNSTTNPNEPELMVVDEPASLSAPSTVHGIYNIAPMPITTETGIASHQPIQNLA